jgi:hypothetical protein
VLGVCWQRCLSADPCSTSMTVDTCFWCTPLLFPWPCMESQCLCIVYCDPEVVKTHICCVVANSFRILIEVSHPVCWFSLLHPGSTPIACTKSALSCSKVPCWVQSLSYLQFSSCFWCIFPWIRLVFYSWRSTSCMFFTLLFFLVFQEV